MHIEQLREIMKLSGFVVSLSLAVSILFGCVFGIPWAISKYTEKKACEEFVQKFPQQKVFYSIGTGCLYHPEGSSQWWSLR